MYSEDTIGLDFNTIDILYSFQLCHHVLSALAHISMLDFGYCGGDFFWCPCSVQ